MGGAPNAGKLSARRPRPGHRPERLATMLRQTPAGGNPLAMPCPRCGCPGDYVGHGRYLRHVVHRGREERVEVRRVRCAGCGATHAVIPPGVVPYRAFSEGLVLAVLAAWAAGSSNAEVRRTFGISETTRRRMLSGARRRACALLACGASRAAVDAALAAAGVGAVPALHMAEYGTRFAERVRLANAHARPRGRPGPST